MVTLLDSRQLTGADRRPAAVVARLRGGEDVGSAGVLTLYHSYLDRLFTAGSGTFT